MSDRCERSRVFQQSGPDDWGSFPGSFLPLSPVFALVGFVGLCLLVGAVGGAITARAVHSWYLELQPPLGTPPNWIFAPVWTSLYILMGTSAWLVWKKMGASRPLLLWGWQLAANAAWSPVFFGLHSLAGALAILILLLVLLGLTIRAFHGVSRVAAGLLVPYALWSVYACYLNAGFLLLNHL